MQHRYAQIYKDSDGYGYVESDSYLSGLVKMDTMIPVEEGFDLKGKRWNISSEKWETYTLPEPEPPQPTQLDRIEGLLVQSVTDIENNAIDRYNLELVKEGVL